MLRAICMCLLPALACGGELDSAVARAMTGRQGTVLAAEVATGKLLAAWRPGLARGIAASPGSTMKPFTLAAWIGQHGGAAPGAWPCARQLRIGGRRLDCAHPLLAAPPDAVAALAYSCNCYFAHLALSLDAAGFARRLRGMAANVSTAATPEQLQQQAIGEWGIEVTPEEWLAAWRRLARERDQPELAPVFAGLEGAAAYGSGRLAAVPGLAVAGKTGTGPGHAWFAGFAPAAAPRIVVVVFLRQGRGGADAAPVAREIFRAWQRGRR